MRDRFAAVDVVVRFFRKNERKL